MATEAFVHQGSPQRVVFGAGALTRVGEEARRLGIRRTLVLSTPGHRDAAERVAGLLGDAAAGVFARATMHTPVAVTEAALARVRDMGVDGAIAIGGGSTIGLSKAIAIRTDLPQIAIPTTYAGSEATDILGETDDGQKTTRRDPRVLPETVIYDVDLTLTLPAAITAASGMNAIAHAVEGLYARNAGPLLRLMAEDGIRALAAALPRIARAPKESDARSDALYGAWLCGAVLGSAEMGLHHKLCHVLGGSFGLPHAETHTAILPHAVAYNAAAAPEAMARVARALGAPEAAGGLHGLGQMIGAPTALRDIGMPKDGLDRAADVAVANPYNNPRPLDRGAIRALLDDAWHGRRPMEGTS